MYNSIVPIPGFRLCQTARQPDKFHCSPSPNFKILLGKILINFYRHFMLFHSTKQTFTRYLPIELQYQRFELYTNICNL